MFTVYHYNFGSSLNGSFATLEAAVDAAKRAGFQASIRRDGKHVASWCPISGRGR